MNIREDKLKILYVAPHLSTGGMPQYLLKMMEEFYESSIIYCVEFSQITGGHYIVQRSKIQELLGSANFFPLEENKSKLIEIINKINPDIIHFQEFVEDFISHDLLIKIYNSDRSYFIIETTHSSTSNLESKKFFPDRYVFASNFSMEKFKNDTIEKTIWEYPIENFERPDRDSTMIQLGLDPSKKHILNVGLFTPGKNQKKIFDIARLMDNEYVFNFVGNQADNFKNYWQPLMSNKPDNCTIFGERSDVNKFMSCCDYFLFTSTLELNPLVIKEALSWNIPILMYNLPAYMNAYSNVDGITFINDMQDIEICNLLRTNTSVNSDIIENPYKPLDIDKIKLILILNKIGDIEKLTISQFLKLDGIDLSILQTPLSTNIPINPGFIDNQKMPNFTPGHWGCFNSFKKALLDNKDLDFVIVCERDCKIESPDIIRYIKKACYLMSKLNIDIFSFGDTKDLEFGVNQSDVIERIDDECFITNKIIGLQFQIFSKDSISFLEDQFKKVGWNGMDIWLNIVYSNTNRKRAIFDKRLTTQWDGISSIDGEYKKFL